MHDLQAFAVLIFYVRAVAIINSVHSSTEDQVNLPALILFHIFSQTILTGTVVRLKKSIKWPCQGSVHALPLPFSLTQFLLFFHSGIWPDSTCYFLYHVLFPLWMCPKDTEAYHQLLMFPSFPVLNCTSEKHTWKIWQWYIHAQKNGC